MWVVWAIVLCIMVAAVIMILLGAMGLLWYNFANPENNDEIDDPEFWRDFEETDDEDSENRLP